MKNLLSITLMLAAVAALAQSSFEVQYGAYLKASKAMWQQSIQLAEKESGAESFEKAMAMYGLLNNTMATQDEKTFKENLDGTVDLLKSIIEEQPEWGEPRAVLSSVYGLVMAYSPMKGMLYGSKSSTLMSEALKLQPESPLVHKLYAGSKLYTPKMFGGDPEEAVTSFKKSLELYEKGEVNENWLYLDTHMGLSLSYMKMDDNSSAKETLEKAVAMEPEYYWAKSVLTSIEEEAK